MGEGREGGVRSPAHYHLVITTPVSGLMPSAFGKSGCTGSVVVWTCLAVSQVLGILRRVAGYSRLKATCLAL